MATTDAPALRQRSAAAEYTLIMTRFRTLPHFILATFCVAASVSSCATRVPIGTELAADSRDHEVVVTLPFVTNRRLEAAASIGSYYGGDHGELTAGRCTVGFEQDERRGELLRVDPLPIHSVVETTEASSLVIYVHGYSESFAKSCRRAALLQHRLRLDGRLLLFSWPSSNYLTYAQDADDLKRSLDPLRRLLETAAASVGNERLVLIAHSMGSRGVLDALKLQDSGAGKISHVIFVAPDIRRDVFIENVPMLGERVSDVTVYTSDNDRVLWLSTTVNASGRLGVAREFELDTERMNVIDITPTGVNHISGHMYHLFNPAVIEDLRELLGSATTGADRAYRRVAGGQAGFFVLEPELSGD